LPSLSPLVIARLGIESSLLRPSIQSTAAAEPVKRLQWSVCTT
jgi:hypothetical protein